MAKITNPLDSPRLLDKVSSLKTAYSGISIVASVLLLRFFIAFEWLTSSTSKLQSILATPDTYLGRFPTVFSNVWGELPTPEGCGLLASSAKLAYPPSPDK